ncbi:MAG: PAS domain S-box protein [Methanospirillum sp.]|uniref:PAS domain S-box protein n=1 Tax=Methanospirillum sp. TaxID=45200 RepID=UPI00236D55DA|nr:PAS domain S-box protein [Methanospirillum sp.]MDD1730257.1 PAS domain S-box protein [Methanospirillum sp.]
MVPQSETPPPKENLTQIVSLLIIAISIIFYSDITTPLGLMTWILYFIPLFLTLYIRWQYGPFLVAGTAIILTCISFFISPRDMSEFYALINRGFFSVLLIVSAALIWRNKKREELLQISEERYQSMIESSPEAVLILRDETIQYSNPANLDLFGPKNGVTGREWVHLFDPETRDQILSSITKATEGAKIELSDIGIGLSDGRNHIADLWIGEILWDGEPAVMMIIRKKSD